MAYCVIGEPEYAVQLCNQWLVDEPDSSVAKHTLAAVSGQNVPLRAPDDYVQQIFDSFAASFEAKLARLNYRAPSLVAMSLGRGRSCPPNARSTSSTSDAARASAGRCWRRMRGRWSGWISPTGMLKHAAAEAGLPRAGPGGADGVPARVNTDGSTSS